MEIIMQETTVLKIISSTPLLSPPWKIKTSTTATSTLSSQRQQPVLASTYGRELHESPIMMGKKSELVGHGLRFLSKQPVESSSVAQVRKQRQKRPSRQFGLFSSWDFPFSKNQYSDPQPPDEPVKKINSPIHTVPSGVDLATSPANKTTSARAGKPTIKDRVQGRFSIDIVRSTHVPSNMYPTHATPSLCRVPVGPSTLQHINQHLTDDMPPLVPIELVSSPPPRQQQQQTPTSIITIQFQNQLPHPPIPSIIITPPTPAKSLPTELESFFESHDSDEDTLRESDSEYDDLDSADDEDEWQQIEMQTNATRHSNQQYKSINGNEFLSVPESFVPYAHLYRRFRSDDAMSKRNWYG
ncbi:hypothetical protein HDU76_004947 [Blyttiomyces sp. JEL0837]|nr:hypothetical protein HDU76_004947 [Blyttiomyces sp. JEL0837]